MTEPSAFYRKEAARCPRLRIDQESRHMFWRSVEETPGTYKRAPPGGEEGGEEGGEREKARFAGKSATCHVQVLVSASRCSPTAGARSPQVLTVASRSPWLLACRGFSLAVASRSPWLRASAKWATPFRCALPCASALSSFPRCGPFSDKCTGAGRDLTCATSTTA